MKKIKNIAIIPARGGSKRIPKKNIKNFLGKSIIAYSIETALQSNIFDEVMVSTDDNEIAEIAIKYGAKAPFFRSKETSDDFATISDVVSEVIKEYKNQKQTEFENICCILPTAPFIQIEDLKKSYNKLINSNFDSIFSVVKFHFPIQRAMQFNEEKIQLIWTENLNKRSQDLPESYHDAGLFYWIKTDAFLQQKKIWTNNTSAIIIDSQKAQDIDTLEDWKIAEMKYKIWKENE